MAKRRSEPLDTGRRVPISIRMDPLVLRALRIEARKRGTGYQSLIHTILSQRLIRRAMASATARERCHAS